MKIFVSTLLLVSVILPMSTHAEASKFNLDLEPIVFDSENTNSSSLGLNFSIDGKLLDKKFDSEVADDSGDIDVDAVIGGYDLSYVVKGVLAESSAKNPKDFIESRISANYFRSSSNTFKAGFFAKLESDQKFDEQQVAYGITATLAKIDVLSSNDVSAIHINLGQVDPTDDTVRESILGENLETYERVDIELLYIHTIGKGSIDTFEVNYRYFLELDAEAVIEEAGLDEHRLVTYRLGFNNNLYAAYSSGELPFNQRDNQIYEIGFNYKFE